MKVCKVFLTFSTLLAVVIAHHAGGYGGAYGGGLHGGGGGGDFSGPVYYKFGYGVADPHTGDYHQQHEIRDGHVVKGAYSLKEADGTVRLVEYVAGPHSGFNAIVKRIGQAYHPQVYGVAHGGGGGGGHGGYYGGGGGGGGGQSHVKPAHFGYHY